MATGISVLLEPPARRPNHLETGQRPNKSLNRIEGLGDDALDRRGCGHLDNGALMQVLITGFCSRDLKACPGTFDNRPQHGALVFQRATRREVELDNQGANHTPSMPEPRARAWITAVMSGPADLN